MAALRHGIRTVIIPRDNLRDLEQIDQTVRSALNFVSAETIDTVLETALNRKSDSIHSIFNDIPGEVMVKSRKNTIRQ